MIWRDINAAPKRLRSRFCRRQNIDELREREARACSSREQDRMACDASICVISGLSHGFRTIKYTVIQFRSKAENTEKKWKDEGAGLFREQDR